MSDEDNPFLRPGGWSLTQSTNPSFYPSGYNLMIGRNKMGTNVFDIVWTEQDGSICYLEAIDYVPAVPGGPPPYLYSPSALGYDPDGTEHTYTVWVVLNPGGTQVSASVAEAPMSGNGVRGDGKLGDAGSLAGLWGADAKPTAPMPQGTEKS